MVANAFDPARAPGNLVCMCDTSSNDECPVGNESKPANRSALEARTEPRLRAIVRALARHAAREHYAQSCFEAKKDSDSEG